MIGLNYTAFLLLYGIYGTPLQYTMRMVLLLTCLMIYKQVERPVHINRIQTAIILSGIIVLAIYTGFELHKTWRILNGPHNDSVVFLNYIGIGIIWLAIAGFWLWKQWLPPVSLESKTSLFNQHLSEYSYRMEKEDYDQALYHLLQAIEAQPNSLYAWCRLAVLQEQFIKNSKQADRALAQAGKILRSHRRPTAHDQAELESCTAQILQHRGSLHQAIEHYLNACDLDPTPQRKTDLDNAKKQLANSQDGL